jgi:colanic acid/amylovoran biosynthesis protein
MASTGTMAAMGFVFWLVVARLYTPGQVGTATVLISASSLIAYLSLVGLNSTLVRFLSSSENKDVQISQAVLIVFVVGAVLSAGYITGLPLYASKIGFIRDNLLYAGSFVVMGAFAGVNLLLDSVFIAERKPQYNAVIDGLIQGLTKLALPMIFLGLGAYGIYASTGVAYVVAAVASILCMRRALGFKLSLNAQNFRDRRIAPSSHVRYSFSSYVSSVLNIAPVMVLPVIVLQTLGAAQAGYYYVVFQVANLLNAVSYAVGESVFAEGSFDESRFRELRRRSGWIIFLLQVPAVAIVAATSRWSLELFGSEYSREGHRLLAVFAIGALAVGLNTWASFLLKLTRQMAALIGSNVVYSIVTIGLALLWAPRGLVWVGGAWLLGNAASGMFAVIALFLHRTNWRDRAVATEADMPSSCCLTHGDASMGTALRIVIINAYMRENAGDAALLSVCLRQIREAFPETLIEVAGMESAESHPEFEGARNLGSIRRYVSDGNVGKILRITRKTLGLLLGVTYLVLPRVLRCRFISWLPDEVAWEVRALAGADLIVSMGGGYINARKGLDGYQNIFYVLLPALIAQRERKPVVFGPQSFGPFTSSPQRWLVRRVLLRSPLVMAREGISVSILERCGVPATHIMEAVDSGFAFNPGPGRSWREELRVDDNAVLIGVTARRWLEPAAQESYERALAEVIDDVQSRDLHHVVLIPQVTSDYMADDDRIVEKRVASYCARTPLCVEEHSDHRDLKNLYGELTYLIGTRFHSVIFALTSRVPCVAIEYEHKTRGIMRDLGLEEWVIKIEDTPDGLRDLFARLQDSRADYLRRLDDVMPAYCQRAEQMVSLLVQVREETSQAAEAMMATAGEQV